MKRVVIVGLSCVLASFQYSWGYQPQAQEPSPGLIDVLADIATAPCSLLATCLGIDSPAQCPYPPRHRLTCVPVKKPCRPAPPGKTVTKVPRATQPPKVQIPPPGTSEVPPAVTRTIPLPPVPRITTQNQTPPTTTQKQAPPQRQTVPGPPTSRPKLPGILPGPSEEPMPVPGASKQPTPSEEQRTTIPQKQTLKKGPDVRPVPPTAGVSEMPGTPKKESAGKPSKPGKSREWAPCMPVRPSPLCVPAPLPAPCGPRWFLR